MLDSFASLVVRVRWLVIAFFVAVSIFFASRIPQMEVDPEVKSMLPPDMPSLTHLDQIEAIFGGTDMVMLVLTADDVLAEATLKRLKKLSKLMERMAGVDRVMSFFTLKDIRSENQQLVVDPAVKRIPRSDEAREKLRAALRDNELVFGNVVSKDFKAVAVIGLLEADAKDETTIALLREIIEQVPGPEPVTIAGMPFVRMHVGYDIRHDMIRFLPIGLLIMLLFLFVCFRQLRGVLLPFVMVIMSILFGMGLIPLLGWKLQMVTVLLPVILIAVANDYGIHIMARYQEDNLPGSDLSSQELARGVIRELLSPVVVTGITTIAGLLCLLSHIIVPAEQLGILASAAVAYALFGSLTFIPAMISLLPRAKPIVAATAEGHEPPWLERRLRATAAFVTRRPWAIIVSSVLVAGACGTGVAWLVVDTNPVNYYEPDAPVAQSSALVDTHFGGSGAIAIMAKGDIKDPALLGELDALEKKLSALEEVGQTSSIAKVVRRMNRVLNPEEAHPDRIPDLRNAVAQYFLLYSMNGDPEDFERMVDFPYENALLTARLNTLSTVAITKVMDLIHQEVAARPQGMFPVVGGFVDVLANLVDAVVEGQVVSLALSLVLVTLLVMILFRSVVAGLLAAIPLSLSMVLLFGLMGIFSIELNVATALLSSIMIGVGIDYTIHFLWRYRTERQRGLAPAAAVLTTLTTTGRGIVFNALSVVIGFSVVLLSNFQPVQFFGFLVVVSIGTCLIGAVGLLPAICLVLRPRFLEPKNLVEASVPQMGG